MEFEQVKEIIIRILQDSLDYAKESKDSEFLRIYLSEIKDNVIRQEKFLAQWENYYEFKNTYET